MRQRAFTLIELLVSLSVLLVVIIATARIFGTTGKVAAIGEASADLQATATAVEKAIRGDIERIARDGVLAIQCVAVRNDVNRTTTYPQAPLLDPTREITDFVRCDQIVFFGRGHEASRVYLGGRAKEQKYAVNTFGGPVETVVSEITSNEFMVRIGHATQFPTLLVNKDPSSPAFDYRTDPDTFGANSTLSPPVPWMWSPRNDQAAYALSSRYFSNDNINITPPLSLAGQPEARLWTLARQVILLADDGYVNPPTDPQINHLTYYHTLAVSNQNANSASGIAQFGHEASSITLGKPETTLSIGQNDLFPNRAITASRVDTAATSIAEFRALVETGSTSANRSKDFNFDLTGRLPWSDQEGSDPTSTTLKLGTIHNRIYNSLFGAPIQVSGAGGLTSKTMGLWGYPRAEKIVSSMNRLDALVTGPLLAGNCSSIQIDWTWSNGTAQFETPEGTPLLAQLPISPFRPATIYDVPLAGLTTQPWPAKQPFMPSYALDTPVTATAGTSIPWFGLPDSLFPFSQRRGVTMLAGPLLTSKGRSLQLSIPGIPNPIDPLSTNYATPIEVLKPEVLMDPNRIAPFTLSDVNIVAIATPPIDCARIEGIAGIARPQGDTTEIYTYQAIFGPNGDKPYREAKFPGGSERVLRTDYTPWPTALRFTITLHDPKLALSQGRVFQFVVELPKAEK